MTGFRLGYGAAPRELAAAMDVVQSHSTSNAASVSQYAGLAALTERAASERAVEVMRRAFRVRRDRLVAGLGGLPGVSSPTPDGAFYVFSDVRGAAARVHDAAAPAVAPDEGGLAAAPGGAGSAEDFCAHLLARHGLALVPGGAFGFEGHVRWSFAAPDEEIEEGVARFREAVLAREG
jgi:aspartate aminotransferase